MVSEFRVRGPAGGNDEFIELRNTSAAPVAIGGWLLQGCANGTPGNPSTRATVNAGVTLAPNQAYLFTNDAASGYSGSVPGDQTYGTGVSDFDVTSTSFAGIRLMNGSTVQPSGRRGIHEQPVPRGHRGSPPRPSTANGVS